MDFRLSRHAEWEMTCRGIQRALVQVGWIHQSRLRFEDGKMYLLRVVVDEDEQPPLIITAYRTSRIEKYWSAE